MKITNHNQNIGSILLRVTILVHKFCVLIKNYNNISRHEIVWFRVHVDDLHTVKTVLKKCYTLV